MMPSHIVQLLKITKTVHSMTSTELVDALEELNDAEYHAAIRAFHDARSSATPNRELQMGVTILRSLYEKSLVAIPKHSKKLLIPAVNWFVTEPANIRAGNRAIAITVLIAAYYASLGEAKIYNDWRKEFATCFDLYSKAYHYMVWQRHNFGQGSLPGQLSAKEQANAELSAASNELEEFLDRVGRA